MDDLAVGQREAEWLDGRLAVDAMAVGAGEVTGATGVGDAGGDRQTS